MGFDDEVLSVGLFAADEEDTLSFVKGLLVFTEMGFEGKLVEISLDEGLVEK